MFQAVFTFLHVFFQCFLHVFSMIFLHRVVTLFSFKIKILLIYMTEIGTPVGRSLVWLGWVAARFAWFVTMDIHGYPWLTMDIHG